MSKKVRLGIIGLGQQGGAYAKFITDGMVPNMEIGAICDTDPAKKELAARPVPGRALLRRLHRHAGQRRRGRRRHLRAALPAPGNGHRRPQAQHPRPRGEAGRRLHQAGQGAQRVRRRQARADLRHHVQPAQQPAVPEAQGDRRQRRDRRASAAPTGSSPPGGVRRATTTPANGAPPGAARAAASWSTRHRTSWTCGSGSAACPKSVYAKVAYGFRRDIAVEDEVTAVVDYGDGATGVFVTATHDLVGHRPLRDPRRPGQDRRREQQDRHRDPPAQARARAQRRHGHGRCPQALHGRAEPRGATTPPRSSSSSPPGARSTPASWRTSPPTSWTAPRCWPRARTASTASGWPTPSTSPAGPARRWRWTSTRTSSSPS